jgi:hypothetical protein
LRIWSATTGGAVQVVAVVEVAEHRAGRDAGAVGDDRRSRLEGPFGEQLHECVEHGDTVVLAPQPTPVDVEIGHGCNLSIDTSSVNT